MPTEQRASRLTVEITAGPAAGRVFWLRSDQTIEVGRTEQAEFVIGSDPQMSSVHFALDCTANGFRVVDRGSTNGTFVNDIRIEEAALKDGDRIVAGCTQFAVHVEAEEKVPRDDQPATSRPGSTTGPAHDESKPSGMATEGVAVGLAGPQPHPGRTMDLSDAAIQYLEIVNGTPFRVALMPRENLQGEPRLTVIVKGTFNFASGHAAPVAEQQLPVFEADQHYDDDPQATVRFETDMVPFKPRTDIVVVGRVYAPRGIPATQVDARLRIGRLDRTLRVFGDRKWLFPTPLAGAPKMTEPQPFQSIELRYERAFGGMDGAAAAYCPENPAGVGFIGARTKDSIHEKPLPNLEDPGDLIVSWDSRPKPVGFGFYGRGWQPRLRFAGTYDDEYREKHAPDLPADFAYDIYNGAHPGLQIAGYLRGNEEVELHNLTPEGYVGFRLPGIHPKITITRCSVSSAEFERLTGSDEEAAAVPVSTWEEGLRCVLDTLVLIPEERVFYLVFRGSCVLKSLEDLDVTRIGVTR